MKLNLLILILISLPYLSIFGRTNIWAEKIGGASFESLNSIDSDNSGNIYVVGIFQTTFLYFNNGISLTKSANNADVFIAKYNNNGICQWAQKIVGLDVSANEITIDTSGNIYLIGSWLSGNLSFNNEISLENAINRDVFLAKYNNNGICQWAQKIYGNASEDGLDIDIHYSGNIYLTGFYNSPSISFNNGKTIEQTNANDLFLAKYNNDGICQWAEKIAGKSTDEGSVLKVDANENVFVGGTFYSDTLLFNNGINLINGGSADLFVSKYDNTGQCIWAQKIAGSSYEFIKDLTTDDYGNIYPIGNFASTNLQFNNGINLTPIGDADVFFAKYNSNGQCIWAQKIGGIYDDLGANIGVDDSTIYAYGYYYSPILNFNNGISLTNSVLFTDPFLAQYNSNGQCIWAEKITGSRDDLSTGLALDESGNIFIAGYFFSNSILFNNGNSLTKSGSYDCFLAKYSNEIINKHEILLKSAWNLISTHIQPQSPDSLHNIMEEIQSNLLIAKNNIGQVFIPSFNINTIGRWDVTQGYLCYMSAADTLTIKGSEIDPSEKSIQLNSGWNTIAYLRNSEMDAPNAFSSITDNNNLLIAKTLDGLVYIPSFSINTIGNLKLGVGYKVYVNSIDTLIYPNN